MTDQYPDQYLNPPEGACTKCDGCKQIANDDNGTAWWAWESLPSPSNLAVALGMVKPLPCPHCNGSGKEPT